MKNCPNKRLAKGYDILIWMTKTGEVLCCGYTGKGEEFLKTLEPKYLNGDILEVKVKPEKFEKRIPRALRAGAVSPETNKVYRFGPNLLH